jgi:hypothetical protein
MTDPQNNQEAIEAWNRYYEDLAAYNSANQNVSYFTSSVALSKPTASTVHTVHTETFQCDACEKLFPNQQHYQSHVAAHVKCTHCEFYAATKVVKMHEEDVHSSGVIVSKLESPEEIANWIEERKRRYPTAANLAEKRKSTSLLPDYPSDEDKAVMKKQKKRPCKYFQQGKCRHGANCTYSHDVQVSTNGKRGTETKETMRFGRKMTSRPLYEQLAEQDEVLRQKESVIHAWKLIIANNFLETPVERKMVEEL